MKPMRILIAFLMAAVLPVQSFSQSPNLEKAGLSLESARKILEENREKLDESRLRRVEGDRKGSRYPRPGGRREDTQESVVGILQPGVPFTYEGVTVSWEVAPEGTSVIDSLGTLTFEGPTAKIEGVKVPVVVAKNEAGMAYVKLADARPMAYVDDVVFRVIDAPKVSKTPGGPPEPMLGDMMSPSLFYALGFRVMASAHPSVQGFPGGPFGADAFYVSRVTPLILDEWVLTFSAKPVTQPGGFEAYAIRAVNGKTGEEAFIPVIWGAGRKIGRFTVNVLEFYEPTGTATLQVEVEADPTVKGRFAYLERLGIPDGTFEERMQELAREFGFEVEWVPFPPEYPESVEYVKQRRVDGWSTSSKHADDLIKPDTWDFVDMEWIDDTHLRIRPRNYMQVVEREQEKVRNEKELSEFRTIFSEEYALETRVYQLRAILASAAKDIVDRELSTFLLAPRKWNYFPSTACRTEETGEFRVIGACNRFALDALPEEGRSEFEKTVQRAEGLVEETVVADAKSNSLIVTAVPRTHERIRELLAKMEGLMSSEESIGPVERYRVKVVLLGGGENGGAGSPGEIRLFSRMDGIVEDILMQAGEEVRKGQAIARLESDDFEIAVREAISGIKGLEAELVPANDALERSKELYKRGTLPKSDLTEAESTCAKLEAELDRARIQLEKAENQLEKTEIVAPDDGTIISLNLRPGQKVDAGQTVGFFRRAVDVETSEVTKASPADSERSKGLMERYGITEGDLEAFGFQMLRELGRSVVTLAAERGETGKARVSLTDEYACELEFQDVREPYVIVRGRLLAEDREQPLIENTLYLEKDTPSMLGVTNLREGLILVVRRRGEREGVSPEVQLPDEVLEYPE
jgi:biotin carboxyl carrier protein